MSESDNISVKVCIMGEPAVGKTTLRKNYIGKGMEGDFLMTLGADLSESTIPISDKITLDVQIWDIAGQDNFAPIIGEYLQGSQGAILVYDMTRGYTFDAITKWLDRLHAANPAMDNNIPFIVVGNKADLDNFYDYEESKITEFIDYINRHQLYTKTPVEHIQTSAKTGYAVQEAFRRLGKIIIRNWIDQGETIEGAADLFDDVEDVPGSETKEPDTAPEIVQDEEEHLVRPSDLLKRRQEVTATQVSPVASVETVVETPKVEIDHSEPVLVKPSEIAFQEVSTEEVKTAVQEEVEEVIEEPKEELSARFDDMDVFSFGEEEEQEENPEKKATTDENTTSDHHDDKQE